MTFYQGPSSGSQQQGMVVASRAWSFIYVVGGNMDCLLPKRDQEDLTPLVTPVACHCVEVLFLWWTLSRSIGLGCRA